ncbi:MAG: hypothetical protein R3C05_10195 [Pirellulaceae bacterium]
MREAITPWVEYRESQGYAVDILDSKPLPSDVLASLRHLAAAGDQPIDAVVLMGDCEIRGPNWPVDPKRHVPTHHLPSPVAASLGSLPTLATDCPYGDFDDDGKIDALRWPHSIRSIRSGRPFVQRLKQYESSQHYGPWRHLVDLTAGVGGFGVMIDTALESVVRGIITSKLPATMQTRHVCKSDKPILSRREVILRNGDQ